LHIDSAEGQGLGLYMTKNQIEGLGGHIEVKSEVGKGTTFKVTLPLNKVEITTPNATTSATNAPDNIN